MHYTVWATQISDSVTTKKNKDILKGMTEIPNFAVLPWVLFNTKVSLGHSVILHGLSSLIMSTKGN